MDRIRLVKTSPSTSKRTGTKCTHEDVTGYNVIYGLSQSKSHRIGHEGSSVNLAGIADFHMQHTKVTESDMSQNTYFWAETYAKPEVFRFFQLLGYSEERIKC